MNHRYLRSACSVSALCLLFVTQQARAAFFAPLAGRAGADHFSFAPSAVSADGSVVVGSTCVDEELSCSTLEAFRWTSGGGGVSLGAGFATDVSADGSVVVGGAHTANGFEAFRWTESGGMAGIGFGGADFWNLSLSADGHTVVGADGGEAFRWTSGGDLVGLGDLGGEFPIVSLDVSADGSVSVGEHRTANGRQAFRWMSAEGLVGLGRLNENEESLVNGVSADGSVVVGTSHAEFRRSEAYRWTSDGGMVGLGYLPGGDSSSAYGVSADGSVVVGSSSWRSAGAIGTEAFVWDPTNGMRSVREVLTELDVDLTGWTLWSATAISADGATIVGGGTNPFGQPEAWLANISAVPEPGSLALMCVAAFSLLRHRRRLH